MRNLSSLFLKSALLSIIALLFWQNYDQPNYGSNHLKYLAFLSPYSTQKYTKAEIDYFLEIALGSEYGVSDPTIKKRIGDVRIKILGSPTREDLITLNQVIDELNNIIFSINIEIDSDNYNLQIYFVPEPEFRKYEPNYIPVNYGFFWNSWNNDIIEYSKILISTVNITQKERSHLIREELTQSLGLMKDSEKYPDSIFYQAWTDTTAYSELDQVVIEMLYLPEIQPGMTRSQVIDILQKSSH